MQIKTTYKGYKNGVYGIYCGFKPEGLQVEQEISVYYPDEGKVFVKNNSLYAICHNKKLLMRNSPEERITKSGSGCPAVYK